MEIIDKVAIITGASSGIGLATSRLFSKEGARVVLASRSFEKLKEIEKELLGSFAIEVDMAKADSISEMIKKVLEKFGRIDILVNNAGQGMSSPVEKIDVDKYRELMELNVIGPLIAMELVIPIMKKQGGGTIVNISSLVSKMYIPGIAAYASTKYALNALSLTAREELKNQNIVVSVVHPYITDTNFFKNTVQPRGVRGTSRADEEVSDGLPPADPPEKVAEKILEAVRAEEGEIKLRELDRL
jgi:short-subunit dehydrogenase